MFHSKSLEKKTLRIWPHSLGNCLLLDPFPLEFLMRSVGGSINRILVWRITVSIFSWTYAGIHVIPPGVTASFSLNLFSTVYWFFHRCSHSTLGKTVLDWCYIIQKYNKPRNLNYIFLLWSLSNSTHGIILHKEELCYSISKLGNKITKVNKIK